MDENYQKHPFLQSPRKASKMLVLLSIVLAAVDVRAMFLNFRRYIILNADLCLSLLFGISQSSGRCTTSDQSIDRQGAAAGTILPCCWNMRHVSCNFHSVHGPVAAIRRQQPPCGDLSGACSYQVGIYPQNYLLIYFSPGFYLKSEGHMYPENQITLRLPLSSTVFRLFLVYARMKT